jgi:RNA polymerase sigma-70 factor (ECF subfamily)
MISLLEDRPPAMAPAQAPAAHPPAADHVLDPDTLGDHLDRMFRAAWALCGSRDEAEDLVQETYARVLARPRIVRGADDVPYLMRVLRNTFISQRRAAARRPQKADLELESLPLADTRGDREPSSVAERHELYASIAQLPVEFREALVAIDIVGLSYREAARALGVAEGTVTSRLHRARARVAAMFIA